MNNHEKQPKKMESNKQAIRFNPDSKQLRNKIFAICEANGAIQEVNADYYNAFLNGPDEGMEAIISFIVRDQATYINKKVLEEEWVSDEQIIEHVTSFLRLIFRGSMGFKKDDYKICFYKPVGPPPDKETEMKLDNKIKESIPLIHKVILKVLENQEHR